MTRDIAIARLRAGKTSPAIVMTLGCSLGSWPADSPSQWRWRWSATGVTGGPFRSRAAAVENAAAWLRSHDWPEPEAASAHIGRTVQLTRRHWAELASYGDSTNAGMHMVLHKLRQLRAAANPSPAFVRGALAGMQAAPETVAAGNEYACKSMRLSAADWADARRYGGGNANRGLRLALTVMRLLIASPQSARKVLELLDANSDKRKL